MPLANTDIFNPVTGFSEALGFNPNWNYGGPRKMGNVYQAARPQYGSWIERTVSDAGYSFDLVFVDRPIEQVRYIQQFYRQFKRGFFTLIDYDNESREHVGRFTAYQDDTHTANLKYTIRVTFEEIPGCPMRNYPADFGAWGCPMNVCDDWLRPNVSTSGAPWVMNNPTNPGADDPPQIEMYAPGAANGNWAQIEYVGWGFTMSFRLSAALGIVNLLIDDNQVLNNLDLSNGTYALGGSGLGSAITVTGTALTITQTQVQLGRHRLKVVATGTKNASATDTGAIFPQIAGVIY